MWGFGFGEGGKDEDCWPEITTEVFLLKIYFDPERQP